MRMFDFSRPRLDVETPCYLEHPYALPGFYISFESNKVIASVWAPMTNSAFTFKSIELSIDELPKLIQDYYDDPELVLKEAFGWTPIKVQKQQAVLTLEDLGL